MVQYVNLKKKNHHSRTCYINNYYIEIALKYRFSAFLSYCCCGYQYSSTVVVRPCVMMNERE